MADRSMRPKKGDLLVRLRDPQGEVTVLIPAKNVTAHHLDVMERLGKLLSEIFKSQGNAALSDLLPKGAERGGYVGSEQDQSADEANGAL